MRVGAGCVVFALLMTVPRLAAAATIAVAEFRWDAELIEPALICDAGDPDCQASAAVFLSTYTLTGLWDGEQPAPTLTGTVALGDGGGFDWLTISPDTGYVDQFGLSTPLPDSASTTILFDFAGVTRSLSALLTAPGFATLEFDAPETPPAEPTPEPASLTLVGLGLAGMARLRQRAAARRSARW